MKTPYLLTLHRIVNKKFTICMKSSFSTFASFFYSIKVKIEAEKENYMKKLLLPVYTKKNEPNAIFKYYILFDIGQRLEFKSKRKAEDYVRKISSYITDSIRVINTVQKELYSAYLENYFRMNNLHCLKIGEILDSYLERLKYFHSYQSNGDACIKFISVYSLLNIVQDGCKLLRRSMKSLKDYNTVSRMNGLLNIITTIYDKLANLKKGNISTVYKESTLRIIHKKEAIKSVM